MSAGHRLGLAFGLTFALAASNAQASKLIAVLPLDVTNTEGKMSKAAQASLEEMLRDTATDALTNQGWTVLSTDNMLQTLRDNGVDTDKCGEGDCPLSAARELKAEKFISGAVQYVEGEYTASIRLIDTATGRILVSERLIGKTVTSLREKFEAKSAAFFAKAGLAVPVQAPPVVAEPGPTPPVVADLPPKPAGAPIELDLPTLPAEILFGEDRNSVLHPRAKTLLVTEIQNLENLFKSTPAESAGRAQMIRRLAEDYVELESAVTLVEISLQKERDALKSSNPNLSMQREQAATQEHRVANQSRQFAERYYSQIRTSYPLAPHSDEVLCYLGFEYARGFDMERTLSTYRELLEKYPKTNCLPRASLAFGNVHVRAALNDPSKWKAAELEYEAILKLVPQPNGAVAQAWYMLGHVYAAEGYAAESLNALKKAIDFSVERNQLPGMSQIADAARADLIPVYASAGDPSGAYNFFHPVSGDLLSDNSRTFRMMNDLGERFMRSKQYREATVLYTDLLGRDGTPGQAEKYRARIAEADHALKNR